MTVTTSHSSSLDEENRVIHIPYKYREGLKGDLRLDRTKERVVFCRHCQTARVVAKDPQKRENVVDACPVCAKDTVAILVVSGQVYSASDKATLKIHLEESYSAYLAGD